MPDAGINNTSQRRRLSHKEYSFLPTVSRPHTSHNYRADKNIHFIKFLRRRRSLPPQKTCRNNNNCDSRCSRPHVGMLYNLSSFGGDGGRKRKVVGLYLHLACTMFWFVNVVWECVARRKWTHCEKADRFDVVSWDTTWFSGLISTELKIQMVLKSY